MRRTRHPGAGFSLTELLIITAVLAVVTAVAIPSLTSLRERMRLSQSAREVERELQSARNKAVLNNRPMRVRFNCPAAGQLRVVELIGTPSVPAAADLAANRCAEGTYPYPAADRDPATRPNLDGPVLRLDSRVQFGAVQTLEFWTDGSAHAGAARPAAHVAGGRDVADAHEHRRFHDPHGNHHGERHWQNHAATGSVTTAGSRSPKPWWPWRSWLPG